MPEANPLKHRGRSVINRLRRRTLGHEDDDVECLDTKSDGYYSEQESQESESDEDSSSELEEEDSSESEEEDCD